MKRAEAKAQGLEFYNTGKPCKNKHNRDRRTSSGKCLSCESDYNSSYGKKYYSENTDRLKAQQKQYRCKAARRRAAKLQRTPAWLSSSERLAIQRKYDEAERLTRETGIIHHVDHEIPLSGEFVSGLHVPDNLQVLTAYANLSKGNRFDKIDRRI